VLPQLGAAVTWKHGHAQQAENGLPAMVCLVLFALPLWLSR